jgi:quaternary ammonium compound-resistance protein SugE
MSWFYLLIAGLLETGWAIGLKYTNGFTKLVPSVITILVMIGSFLFLSMSLKTLPIGTAYAVWTGIGTIGVAVLGILFFGDSVSALRLIFIALITVSVIGLRIVT